MGFMDLFKRPRTEPLPEFPRIKLEDIPSGSILTFMGGNKLTELAGNRLYKHKYVPPAFHAAMYCEDDLFLNVGKFKTIEKLSKEFRTTRRIDVFIYKGLTQEQKNTLCKEAYLNASRPKIGISLPDYAITDYLRFGLTFLKPSEKQFCSESVVLIYEKLGLKICDTKAVDCAPWDLTEYALSNQDKFELRTLWIGPEFK